VEWLQVEPSGGTVDEQARLEVSVDWSRVPQDPEPASIRISGPGFSQEISVPVINPAHPRPMEFNGPVELDGYLAFDAEDYSRAIAGSTLHWKILPDLGRTSGSVTLFPVDAPVLEKDEFGPRLEYDLYFRTAGDYVIELHLGPSLDFQEGEGLRFGLSLDDEEPSIHKVDTWQTLQTWEEAVGDSVRKLTLPLHVPTPGPHTLKLWHVTPGVLFQRVLIDTGGLRPSYLGPPS